MKRLAAALLLGSGLLAQVYSPSVLLRDQPDPTDLKRFAGAIVSNAGARTPRERAEAIWRFFLSDGRFVKPGFWYHIAGWAYEEPTGEVLDPIKLLNSYGFGLCYHIAPLLESVFEAAGFADARVWFLTGHTVAEVYYEGAYHYFDSDMMGYNVAGDGPFAGKPVVSVRDLERSPDIVLGKMETPRTVKSGTVDSPWYPADVRAGAIGGLADLFRSTRDNYLFPFTRYSTGHDMNFVLRPGEKLVRFFRPESPALYYLPYAFDGEQWREFPQEMPRYGIRTTDGPRSQKDSRTWATGRIEYKPPAIGGDRELRFDMPSAWVIIDAQFQARLRLPSAESSVTLETSTDGRSWIAAGTLAGPYDGEWTAEPRVLARSSNGRHTAVSGSYGYQVRVLRRGREVAEIRALTLVSRIQLNPRTLPQLAAGENVLTYRSGPSTVRRSLPVSLPLLANSGLRYVSEAGQGMLCPTARSAETIFELNGAETAFDFGARFLDVRDGLAPDKLTAETRATAVAARRGSAAVEWSPKPDGPWKTVWTFPSDAPGGDGELIERVLRWPEASVSVRDLPRGTRKVYIRLRTSGPCVDNVRASAWRQAEPPAGKLRITHAWRENGAPRQHVEIIGAGVRERSYGIPVGRDPRNEFLSFEALP